MRNADLNDEIREMADDPHVQFYQENQVLSGEYFYQLMTLDLYPNLTFAPRRVDWEPAQLEAPTPIRMLQLGWFPVNLSGCKSREVSSYLRIWFT